MISIYIRSIVSKTLLAKASHLMRLMYMGEVVSPSLRKLKWAKWPWYSTGISRDQRVMFCPTWGFVVHDVIVVAVVMSLFTSSWSWRVSWCLNCVTWTPTTRNLQISNMISAPFQNSNFWILPVFSLELVGHIHQRGGTRLRNSGKNMTLPCYQFYNVKEMGPEGEYDCKYANVSTCCKSK